MTEIPISGQINGRPVAERVLPNTLLLDFLRERGLTGAKPSCELEVCGACTVLLNGAPVSGCTTLAAELDGGAVETVEGFADGTDLSPIQRAFAEELAFQCGFCTPGMIMSSTALLRNNPAPSREDIVHWMDGNICRCTGYGSIIRAVQTASLARPGGKETDVIDDGARQ